jgi:hypothetical protein
MPAGIQANNLSPMGFGQPNMARAAASQGGPGYGMPDRPVPPGQQPRPQAPPGGAGSAPKASPFTATGVPALYASPMGQDAMRAKPSQFPADAVYNRVQSAILNPGPARPPAPAPMPEPNAGAFGPPTGPGQITLGGGVTPVGRPVMSPGLLGPAPMPQAPPPTGMGPMGPMGAMPGPSMGGPNDMAAALQFMQQQLGGGPF